MGEVIRKDAAARDIAADVRTTLANAAARGGAWKGLADEKLGPAAALLDKVIENAAKTSAALVPLEAELDALDGQTDDFLGAKADEMWNLLGRPASDPAYSLIWPGGVATYADGSDDAQPDRMDLLADLLEAGLHPKLDGAWSKAAALEVRTRAAAYRSKVDALRPLRAKARPRSRSRLEPRSRRADRKTATRLGGAEAISRQRRFSTADPQMTCRARGRA